MTRRWLLAVLVCLPTYASAQGAPTIALTANALTVTGLTPGGEIAWYSLSRTPSGYTTRTAQNAGLTNADAAGTAEVELATAPSPIAVWLAIDLTTGAYALADGGLGAFRQIAFPQQSLVPDPEGKLNRLVEPRRYLEVFLARPGVGAWTAAVGEGGEKDDDGALDGSLRVAIDGMVPVGDSPGAPDEVQSKDVLLLVDPRAMEFTAAELEL